MKLAAYLKRVRAIVEPLERDVALRPPAKAAAIAVIEKACGAKLPAELRAAWRTGDGSRGDARVFAHPEYLEGYTFLSLAAAKRERGALKRRAPQYAGYAEPEPRDARIAPGWYCEGWLPFASGADGALLLLVDLAPAKKGKVGQVIAFKHDPDAMSYVAPSFESFLDGSLGAFADDPEELLGIY